MLDFDNEYKESPIFGKNDSYKKKIKSTLKKEITAKSARNASFITLASVLSACNFGGSSDSIAPLNISAIKGPLSNALAFVDRDGDGVHDDGEEFAVTSSTGSASITPTSAVSATDKLVITSITAGQTIGGTTYATGTVDTNTGGAVADLVLKAPSNSTVVTPVTTLVAETGLSETAVKEVLGLPAEMDVLNFNPFAENLSEADKTVALAAEKVALKVYTTVSTIQASAKSSGLDAAKAFATAIEAVGDVVKEQSAAGAKADLADSSIIDKVVTKTETVLTTKLQEAGLDAAAVTAAVNANKAVLATAKAQIKTVNDAADAITSFDATELGAIAKLAVKSGEEAAAAVTAEKAAPGSGAAKFSMKTAEAVETAKATAKAEVQEAKGEEATTTASSGAAAVETPFVLTSGTTVDWAITSDNQGTGKNNISYSDSTDATYTMSGNTMTINLAQGFEFAMLKALLEKEADLKFKLSLASLPTTDDLDNSTTLTITEGANSTVATGEGQIKLTGKYGYKATSTTSTEFIANQDNVSILYTPRSGDSNVTVTTYNAEDTFNIVNNGEVNEAGTIQTFLEVESTAFLGKATSLGYSNLISRFVKDPIVDNKMTFAIDTTDLGLYAGSTKVNTIQTTLNIGNNGTTGGELTGTPRTGSTLTVAKIADLDAFATDVTWQWQKADSSTHTSEAALKNNSNWTDFGSPVNNNGSTGVTFTIPTATTGSTERVGDHIRVKATYTDKQGNSEVFYSNYTAAVETNNAPGGTGVSVTTNYGMTTGSTLTATNGITDTDGIPSSGTGAISYKWQTKNGSSYDDISGATGSTYTLTTAEDGKQIRALASYTDNKGTAESVGSTPTSAIVKDYIYLEKIGSASATEAKLGVYLDTSLLPSGDTINNIRTVVTKFKLKTGNWSDHFEKSSVTSNKYLKVQGQPTTDGATYNSNSSNWTATTNSVSTADTNTVQNMTLINLSGYHNLSSYTANSGQYKMGEVVLDPKTATVGSTINFTLANSLYGYNASDPLTIPDYDFAITF